ncbi:hypothetical protein Hanom_Chr07g00622041 [Helianthus anomalus]
MKLIILVTTPNDLILAIQYHNNTAEIRAKWWLKKTLHTTPCLCAIVSALALSARMPSQPFEFTSSSVMLVLRTSICSLQALTKTLTCTSIFRCLF